MNAKLRFRKTGRCCGNPTNWSTNPVTSMSTGQPTRSRPIIEPNNLHVTENRVVKTNCRSITCSLYTSEESEIDIVTRRRNADGKLTGNSAGILTGNFESLKIPISHIA